MATVTRPQAHQIIITLTPSDVPVVDAVLAANATFLDEWVAQMLSKKRVATVRARRDQLSSKYENASPADKAAIDAILFK